MRLPILVVAAALLLLAGCDNSDNAEKNQQAGNGGASGNQSITQPAPAPGKLKSHTEKLERTPTDCDGKECSTVSIQWQEFEGQHALNETIRRRLIAQLSSNRESGEPEPKSLEGVARSFLAMTDTLPQGADASWQLTGKVKRLGRHGDLLTLEISTYEFTGGAHGMPETHWLNWDLAENKTVPLAGLIKPGQQQAFWKLAEQAHDRWLKDEADADDDFRQAWPFQKTRDYRLGKDGVVLLYQVYTIGPYVMGEPQLTLPWEQARDLVREPYRPKDH